MCFNRNVLSKLIFVHGSASLLCLFYLWENIFYLWVNISEQSFIIFIYFSVYILVYHLYNSSMFCSDFKTTYLLTLRKWYQFVVYVYMYNGAKKGSAFEFMLLEIFICSLIFKKVNELEFSTKYLHNFSSVSVIW